MSSEADTDVFWRPKAIDRVVAQDEYHEDWRIYLNNLNTLNVSKLLKSTENLQRYNLYSRKIVEFFIWIVEDFSLPPEITYLAVDIFDRFWVSHFGDEKTHRLHAEKWKYMEDPNAFSAENSLIALACIQIATKASCTNHVLSVSTIIQYLAVIGAAVDLKIVLAAEIAVCRAIKWRIPNITVLTYVEMFLEEMAQMLVVVKRSQLLVLCVKIINVAITFHSEIYDKLHCAFKKRYIRTDQERRQFLSIEGDQVRLAASIVSTSAMLFDPTEVLAEDMMAYLASTTRYQIKEIKILSKIIVQIILRKTMTETGQTAI